jgi:hypothetical protein
MRFLQHKRLLTPAFVTRTAARAATTQQPQCSNIIACSYYMEVDPKRFSGHRSLYTLERYLAENREAAKRTALERQRQTGFQ